MDIIYLGETSGNIESLLTRCPRFTKFWAGYRVSSRRAVTGSQCQYQSDEGKGKGTVRKGCTKLISTCWAD
jgi:hypothetical protein